MKNWSVFFGFVFLITPLYNGFASSDEMLFDDEISRVLYRADQTDKQIAQSGRIYSDDAATNI